jgi:hypothetical protein
MVVMMALAVMRAMRRRWRMKTAMRIQTTQS